MNAAAFGSSARFPLPPRGPVSQPVPPNLAAMGRPKHPVAHPPLAAAAASVVLGAVTWGSPFRWVDGACLLPAACCLVVMRGHSARPGSLQCPRGGMDGPREGAGPRLLSRASDRGLWQEAWGRGPGNRLCFWALHRAALMSRLQRKYTLTSPHRSVKESPGGRVLSFQDARMLSYFKRMYI